MRPVIAFLTDFGTSDHYVGAMKGVAIGICPDASLIDVTHGVPAQDVLTGALELSAAYRYFPPGTVFVVVIDPGVGSTRRGIAAEAGGYRFVAPDNGVLSLVFRDTPPAMVVDLTAAKYQHGRVSRTFEGRDRFAPAAAWVATGVHVASLGTRITDWTTITVPEPRVEDDVVQGQVLRVDRFGNLITNIDRSTHDRVARGRRMAVTIDGRPAGPVVNTYAEAPAGACCALFGSGDYLEVAVNGGSAAGQLGAGRGTPVTVRAC